MDKLKKELQLMICIDLEFDNQIEQVLKFAHVEMIDRIVNYDNFGNVEMFLHLPIESEVLRTKVFTKIRFKSKVNNEMVSIVIKNESLLEMKFDTVYNIKEFR